MLESGETERSSCPTKNALRTGDLLPLTNHVRSIVRRARAALAICVMWVWLDVTMA